MGPEKVEKAGEAKTRTGEGWRRFPEKVPGEGSEKVPGEVGQDFFNIQYSRFFASLGLFSGWFGMVFDC